MRGKEVVLSRWREYFDYFLNLRDDREAELNYLGRGGVENMIRREVENMNLEEELENCRK